MGCVFTLSTHTSYSIVFSKKEKGAKKNTREYSHRLWSTIKLNRHTHGKRCRTRTLSNVRAPRAYLCRFVLHPHTCTTPWSTRILVQIRVPPLHPYITDCILNIYTYTHTHTRTYLGWYKLMIEYSPILNIFEPVGRRVATKMCQSPAGAGFAAMFENSQVAGVLVLRLQGLKCLRRRANIFPMPSFIARG